MFYSTVCCKTPRTMLRASQDIGDVVAVLLWKPMTQKASKQASRPAKAAHTTTPHTTQRKPKDKRAADPTASGSPRHQGNPKTAPPPQAQTEKVSVRTVK